MTKLIGFGGQQDLPHLVQHQRVRQSASRQSPRRFGQGHWYNAKGARFADGIAELHGGTLESRSFALLWKELSQRDGPLPKYDQVQHPVSLRAENAREGLKNEMNMNAVTVPVGFLEVCRRSELVR